MVEVADLDQPSKGAMVKGYYTLSGLDDSLDAYLRCALPMVIILCAFRVSRKF
jgi:hypothetical protein